MTQQPFSRPGAIDLSGLGRPPAPQQAAPAAGAAAGSGSAGGAYSVAITQENFQQVLQESMTAPVVIVFHSAAQAPGSEQYAADVAAEAERLEGRLLAALVDVDAHPEIAQAMQIPQVPLTMVVLDGRPVSQPIPGALSPEELSTLFSQLGQQLTAQGITGRHQPRAGGAPAAEGEEEVVDPRYAPAEDALAAGDIDAAVAEYQKLLDANPADAEAAGGLAIAKVMQRTQGVDLNTARAAAADNPDDVDAQTLVADLDMLGGHVEDAFTRLVNLVARTSDKDREKARDHLLGLFAAVGNDDPRVLAGRRNLASALF
ncbi:tetratricopeptide repeat protein [Nocardioides cavernae]|uniref:Tetratricopeptide repeat protein n=1 Tax=Nocardioides cavernae TaxID=1921566 RepID=A0ABR8NF74_9ACTN|nr:tetratricopeptide repeat protein [Nocardioides cavernae]MBD3925529.1 tetratricopeptide repeat protein [Nocardioides cavernae]MBM7514092.1 putative thioredoxin [Nocardioides cavernae]